jgi:ornithine carbamoyltransferase
MHCLPAINGSDSNYSEFVKERLSKKFPWVSKGEVEVTAEVFNSANSVVFQQAQNRLFAMEAILRWLLAVNHK